MATLREEHRAHEICYEYLKRTKVFRKIAFKDDKEEEEKVYTRENLILKHDLHLFDIFTLCGGNNAEYESVTRLPASGVMRWKIWKEAQYKLSIDNKLLSHGLDKIYGKS